VGSSGTVREEGDAGTWYLTPRRKKLMIMGNNILVKVCIKIEIYLFQLVMSFGDFLGYGVYPNLLHNTRLPLNPSDFIVIILQVYIVFFLNFIIHLLSLKHYCSIFRLKNIFFFFACYRLKWRHSNFTRA
jgi:hypothetical protein